jgi:hypothetical protein
MNIKITELLEERKKFPISNLRNSEAPYIENKLAVENEKVGLILPISFLHSLRDTELRGELFNKWRIAGLFDLAEIWRPYAGVKFVLLILQTKPPKHVYFSRYLAEDTFIGKVDRNNYGALGEQKISKSYQSYLNELEETIRKGTITNGKDNAFSIWKLDYSDIDLNRLHINYYDIEAREALKKLAQEKTEPLRDLAEIYKPRKVRDTKGLVIKTKNFSYPLTKNELAEEEQTTIQLKRGDILFSASFSGSNKFYLISEEPKQPVFASTFLVVLRPKSSKINPEYLFLYLQSETAMKYVQLIQRGNFFPQILTKDLLELPVIIPDKVTQRKSEAVYRTLFLKEKADLIQSINKELFDTTISDKPIQKEFILEELEELRMYKKEVIVKVIQGDLKELNTCIDKKLYKSFLILSGSVLEAFLLDWLSEIERKDYFSSSAEDYTLGKLLWKLKKVHKSVFDEDLITRADKIRKRRNFVHPKEYFNTNQSLGNKLCYEVIDDLKVIIKKRN